MTTTALMPTYARADLAFESGEGAWLVATDGRRYLDFVSGIAVCALGHAHPHLVAALVEQAGKVWHTSNMFRIPGQERLAQRLVEHSFADYVFFANSGAEAVEAAIKTARKYHFAAGRPERWRIITFEGAFHGRTLATIAAGGQAKHLEGFGPPVPGFDQVPFGDHDALEAAIGEETAAIMIEPVQGEGGLRPVPDQCLVGLRRLCDARGLLLIYDEVQTGMGRTGKLFAHEWAGPEATPDIMSSAKAIGGGFPLGACFATERAAAGMVADSHGSTYGGNPLAMAVGNAVLDVMLEPGFFDRVNDIANKLAQGLAMIADQHPTLVEELRGKGLMRGLKLKGIEARTVIGHLRERGLLAAVAGDNVLRLLPPLIVNEDELRLGLELIDQTLGALAKAELQAAS